MAVAITAACAPPVPAVADEPKFGPGGDFHRELRRRVDQYFRTTGRRPRDCPRMYLKTAVLFGGVFASYGLLVFVVGTWWLALPLALFLGMAVAGLAFNVQHDGGHHAYSDRGWVNKLAALTLDFLGGSSYVWARKHNSIHHTYANITGHDDDIDLGFLGRLSPHQRRRTFHRFQHLYLWALYGFLPVKWQFYQDFHDLIAGRAGGRRMARPRGWDLATFFGGKAVFFSLALAVPLLFHSAWVVLPLFLASSFVTGLAISVVFQLAHCVEEAAFPMPRPDTGRMETDWAAHQVQTTVDFARGNRALSWLIGGLNFQIEHHLLPQICHVHYPALSRVVEQTCRDFGLRYRAHPTFRASVASHYRWLRRMGTADA